ncbi:hypothetical protein [Candidatus Pelagibacter sp. HIMB1493]
MKIILFLLCLATLVSCNNAYETKVNDNNEKQNKIIMKVTAATDIKVKK